MNDAEIRLFIQNNIDFQHESFDAWPLKCEGCLEINKPLFLFYPYHKSEGMEDITADGYYCQYCIEKMTPEEWGIDPEEISNPAGPNPLIANMQNLDEFNVAQYWSKVQTGEIKGPDLDKLNFSKTNEFKGQEHGYILPNGDFYPCKYYQHGLLERYLLKNEIVRIGRKRIDPWPLSSKEFDDVCLKISRFEACHVESLTQKQLDTLFDWCMDNSLDIPFWLSNKIDNKEE